MQSKLSLAALAGVLLSGGLACAEPYLSIDLPERTRLLVDQRVDLVVEARNMPSPVGFKVTANGRDITSQFTSKSVDLDCDGRQDTLYRADLVSFKDAGYMRIIASLDSAAGSLTAIKDLQIFPFQPAMNRRNIVLFIGDAMGTAYRDAGRIVSRSTETVPNVSGFREGFFDHLLEMDRMPVSGMVMTYASDRVIPDSANTATAWATGNKTFEGALGVFADGTDCAWASGQNQGNLAQSIDNPRIETLWEYLKRKYGYRTGIVSTAFITDATPAGQGAHTASRAFTFEVARQYLENPMLGGEPGFDLIFGGGKEDFDPDIRADGRDLVKEFQAKGFQFVSNRSEMQAVTSGKVLGLFRRPNTVARASSGIRPTANGNMDTAYDKLGLVRPGSEPAANLGSYTDQPMLDQMTAKAIEILGGQGGTQPFVVMVEGALIDKQSHPNHSAGVIWDVIELDKAVGVARAFAQQNEKTLVIATADHDQSMSIVGVNEITDADLTDRTSFYSVAVNSPVGDQSAKVFGDSYSNIRSSYGYFSPGNDPNSTGKEGAPGKTYQAIYTSGFPDYIDSNGDGYPENRQTGDKGRKRLSVGFRTGNHTGSSVPITAEGPGAFLFTGYMDQTDIALKMAVSLSGDTVEGDAFVKNVLLNPRYPAVIGK